jgi:hypothetical protein
MHSKADFRWHRPMGRAGHRSPLGERREAVPAANWDGMGGWIDDWSGYGPSFFVPAGLDKSPMIFQTLEDAREKLGKCLAF